jgi:hypothetical protein
MVVMIGGGGGEANRIRFLLYPGIFLKTEGSHLKSVTVAG